MIGQFSRNDTSGGGKEEAIAEKILPASALEAPCAAEQKQDRSLMRLALAYAAQAAALDEVPVGAVIVSPEGRLLAGAGNCCVAANDPVGHAEIRALRAAAEKVGNYRLPGSTLYVTLEPCPMCASALLLSRVSRIVFGAADPKSGGIQSVYRIGGDGCLNHRFSVTGGVLAEECGGILRKFFRRRRKKSRDAIFSLSKN